jgi:hypothetical protein
MKIIESSDPTKVEASEIRWMLTERVAMTTAVCNELDAGGTNANYRAKALLGHLRGWISDTLNSTSARPDEGLDELEVQAELQPMLNECIVGARVCKVLSMYWTADNGTELASDEAKLQYNLAEWRRARAAGFAATTDDHQVSAPKGKHLYMIEQNDLRLRKVGIAKSAGRLEEWTRRGWTLLETIRYATLDELRADETVALYRLDQFHARGSTRMKAWFPNLTPDGRTEMFDPICFRGTLRDLLSPELDAKLKHVERIAPLWISEPRSEAARKAHQHPNRDQSAAAKKAWVTMRANESAEPVAPG